MSKLLSFVYAYYENRDMYIRQAQEWNSYPQEVKDNISIFVTDDCSTKHPLRDITNTPKGVDLHRFEILEKKPWNWLACRNIGASESRDQWLILTDMDHLISASNAIKIINFLKGTKVRPANIYLFSRVDAPDMMKYKPHSDSFMMTKKMYWKVGGYDEELSGNYGTSGRYRTRAKSVCKDMVRLGIPLIRYSREVIQDASTVEFVRKGRGRDPKAIQRIINKKKMEGRENEIKVLSLPYRRIAQ